MTSKSLYERLFCSGSFGSDVADRSFLMNIVSTLAPMPKPF